MLSGQNVEQERKYTLDFKNMVNINLDFEKSYAELIKLYSKLMLLADKLVETDGHAVACRFTGCTCGSIEAYKIARAEYLDFRRKYTGED